MNRGITLNNPKIPIRQIIERATPLDAKNAGKAKAQVKLFVRNRPLSSK
jgi:hypothetical protein